MSQLKFDEVVVIEWYRSDSAATDLEANDWHWNGEIEASGSLYLFKLADELVAWSSRRGTRFHIHLQSTQSIQENIRDVRKNFSGNQNQSVQIMCVGNPEWEEELEIGPSDIFGSNSGDGTGSEISLKKHKTAVKKHSNRLICVHGNVHKGSPSECGEKEIEEDAFWDKFEPVNSMERSAFILAK